MNKNKAQQADDVSPDRINEIVQGFQKSRILLTAYELGLFTALSGKGKSAADTAKLLGTEKQATERLMNALCAIDLVEKKGDMFSNSPAAEKFLVKHNPDFMAGFQHCVHLWDTWSTLTQAVHKGTSVINRQINDRGDQWLSAFIAAMHHRAQKHAPGIIAKLDLANVRHVLDVGGGSGAFAMAFVKAKKGLKATVFDLPNVVPLTKQYIEKEGFSGKIDTIVGDYHVDEIGNGYDLIFLSAIVHSNSAEENIKLLVKCSRALNPGGQVVVVDFIMEEDRAKPAYGAIFSLNMLVGTEAGDTYTETEVKNWMKEAGLSGMTRIDTPFNASLIVGRKIGN